MATPTGPDIFTSVQDVIAQADAARNAQKKDVKKPINVGQTAVFTAKIATVATFALAVLYTGVKIYSYFNPSEESECSSPTEDHTAGFPAVDPMLENVCRVICGTVTNIATNALCRLTKCND
ncbi:hypothetical protein COB11_07195 [Candidatus Aerophobetes bacterium]|uniref:Uncharacterized protein n=1 Tax=Aerophobetes bacterium TaxID=2030807 RepID=A0A2A4YDY1_UNCAE|nr:MAG: hypothetical protein COB11_07195 [Candidatus Aerophobetes bacterium]